MTEKSNVVELRRRAPTPTASKIVCECESDAWEIILFDLPDDVIEGLSIACFQCKECGSQVDAAIVWPEQED